MATLVRALLDHPGPTVTALQRLKQWTGAAWRVIPIKIVNGSLVFEIKPLKRWADTTWELTHE